MFRGSSFAEIFCENIPMRINVTARPSSRAERIEKNAEGEFTVSVNEPPVGGRANRAIIRVLSEYFKVRTTNVRIVFGHTSRRKVIEIS